MTAPAWLTELFGWREATAKSEARCRNLFGQAVAPNIADVGGVESLRIAGAIYDLVGIPRSKQRGVLQDEPESATSSGAALERGVEQDLHSSLAAIDNTRNWSVTRSGDASAYRQFRHLGALQRLFEQDETLRTALGRDYHVKTDVYVGVQPPNGSEPFLHAAVSCKWTIRSDRVQNVRHEFATLVRNRRGRLPHLVLITAEPLPSRLVSIARGTGEVDAVYHLMFDELDQALQTCGTTQGQQDQWNELVQQQRIKSYDELATDLSLS